MEAAHQLDADSPPGGGQSPDGNLTIDELAERVGMSVRNLREWKTLGLLPAAELRGRVGYYHPQVVERIRQIEELRTEGFKLELISRMLDTGGEAGDEVLRLAGTLRIPFAARREVAEARLAEIALELGVLGMSEEQIAGATAAIGEHTEAIAELFEGVWREQIWNPFVAAGMPAERLPQIVEAATKVQPLALDAVVALFAIAMEAQIELGIERELRQAAAPDLDPSELRFAP